jgi:hypothetical protein
MGYKSASIGPPSNKMEVGDEVVGEISFETAGFRGEVDEKNSKVLAKRLKESYTKKK